MPPVEVNLTGAGIWVAALALIGILVRQIVPWKKQAADAEARLRDDLIRRLEKVERTLDSERAIHKAEQSLDRHQLKNITQCFDALLLLIEMAPEKAKEAVAKIKEMRGVQLKAEAEEKAIIRVAEIAAAEREVAVLSGESA